MSRSTRIGSFSVLLIGVALAYVATLFGIKVAALLVTPSGFQPFFLLGLILIAIAVLLVAFPISVFGPFVSRPHLGRPAIVICAALCAITAAFLSAVAKHGLPVDVGGGSILWDVVLLWALIPLLTGFWATISTR